MVCFGGFDIMLLPLKGRAQVCEVPLGGGHGCWMVPFLPVFGRAGLWLLSGVHGLVGLHVGWCTLGRFGCAELRLRGLSGMDGWMHRMGGWMDGAPASPQWSTPAGPAARLFLES